MNEKFTSGPWIAECVGVSYAGPDATDVYEVTNGYRRIAEHMTEADAKLTAAAPDLYEALKDCIEALTHIESMGMRVNPPTLEKAKAALAKAAP